MPTASQVADYRAAQSAVTTLAERDLHRFFARISRAGDADQIRDDLLEFTPGLVSKYKDTATLLAADWVDLTTAGWFRDLGKVRASSNARAVLDTIMGQPAPTEQVAAATRWALSPLYTEDPRPEDALKLLSGSMQRLVLQAGRGLIWDEASQLSAEIGMRVGVIRQPSGQDTCEFCVMLASRGPMYVGLESAGGVTGRGSTRSGFDDAGRRLSGGVGGGIKARGSQDLGDGFHDNCDCVPVLIRTPDDYPSSYDQDRYLKMYRAGTGEGRYDAD